jgi:uncharacterized protein DUF2652
LNQIVLLIADISGYTKFLRLHRLSTSHAQQVITELLESVIDAATPPLKVSEVEGDAVFFYAMEIENLLAQTQLTESVSVQLIALFRAFYQKLVDLSSRNLCFCDACRNVLSLKMKLIMHLGEVSIQRVKTFEKLFGTDVILTHRLLKNSVPSKEYVLMTSETYSSVGRFHQLKPDTRKENCEGIGNVDVVVFYPTADLIGIHDMRTSVKSPSIFSRLQQFRRIAFNGFLLLTGLKKPQRFHNLRM